MRNLLLISNSTLHGSGYLDHCEPQIKSFLQDTQVKVVTFVPYARPSGKTHDEYTKIARERFERMGFELESVHEHEDPQKAISLAQSIFIGGGNTFVLLNDLYKNYLLHPIRQAINEGASYIGTSAGSNVAGRTIMTTNDMPIVYPPSFHALGLAPFIINPHYQDALVLPAEVRKKFDELINSDPGLAPLLVLNHHIDHQGETRETRIKEYHVFNDDTVVGLREGAMLHVTDDQVRLMGSIGARIFRRGQESTEHLPGASLDFLLDVSHKTEDRLGYLDHVALKSGNRSIE